ncbi:hypothetical protein AAE478_002735 [Parahypoxylon ruwenzoriense]
MPGGGGGGGRGGGSGNAGASSGGSRGRGINNPGTLAGLVIAIVVAVGAFSVLICFIIMRRRKARSRPLTVPEQEGEGRRVRMLSWGRGLLGWNAQRCHDEKPSGQQHESV